MRTGNSGINTLIEITKAPAFISSSRALNQTVVSNLVATLVPVQGLMGSTGPTHHSLLPGKGIRRPAPQSQRATSG